MSKSKLQHYIDKYKKKLNLTDYYIDYFISDDKHWISNNDNDSSKKIKVDYYAKVNKESHKNFVIVFTKSALYNDLQDTVIHELLHVALWDWYGIYELLINISDLGDSAKSKLIEKFRDKEHEIIEKLIPLIK